MLIRKNIILPDRQEALGNDYQEEVDTMCMRWRADGRLGTGPRGPVNVTVVVKPLSNVLPQEKHKIFMAAGKGLV